MIIADTVLQSGATSAANGSAYDLGGANLTLTIYLTGVGVTSGGTIQLETSDDPTYSGTWAPLGSAINASTVSGNKKSVTVVSGAYRVVRARIATDITGGGSINARLVAAA